MFSANFRRLYYVTDKVIVRNLRGKRFVPEANPGLQRRIEEFQKEGLKIEDEDADEFIEQSESDFYNVGEAYKTHVNEVKISKSTLQQHIIKEKYFKENLPNLLTWSEKEQIRHLAATEPDEWTPEKIAESFPVSVPIVKKLLKYAWKPATPERIARHDASAMRNWRELKEGSLKISEGFRQHLLKFSERTIPTLSPQSVKIDLTQEIKMGEFEKIIRRCAVSDENPQNKTSAPNIETDEIKSKLAKKDSKIVTLDELANKIKKRLDKSKKVDLNDAIMLNTVTEKHEVGLRDVDKEIEMISEEKKTLELTHFKENDANDSLETNYLRRIRIPKKAYKRGATYKVNDCYYDADGTFLYRVMGMTD